MKEQLIRRQRRREFWEYVNQIEDMSEKFWKIKLLKMKKKTMKN